jgi:hypothetical protein
MSTAQIDAYIAELPEWQRENIRRFRAAIHRAAPDVDEGWKWDVPVFLVKGRVVWSVAAFKAHTKYNFFEGAALADPDHLFNSGLDSKKSRSINLAEGESVDVAQLDHLVVEAFAVASAAPARKSR